jgi:TonB-linked SusC/RagA family outer membrane protein
MLTDNKLTIMRFIQTTLFTFFIFLTGVGVVSAQNKITVKGKVIDLVDNTPKASVSIAEGTKVLGKTDENGIFSIQVNLGTELTFTFSGYNSVKKTVTSAQEELTIEMNVKQDAMKEVVVQGFSRKTRETVTGATTLLSGKDIQDVPVANVMELLQGRIAGVNIQNNTGSPGAMGTIQMRGLSSTQISSDGFLTPTSPLFVIDGAQIDMNSNFEYGFQGGGPGISPLALIPPEDIESMEFLKDAGATSQYGSRGAYGVVVVTTKRGRSKVPIVAYTGNVFMNVAPPQQKVLGGNYERRARINQILNYDTSYTNAMRLINETPFLADSLNPYYNNSTDWQDLFFTTTYNHSHNIRISGGDRQFNYKTNLNYYDEQGIMRNTGFKRYSLNLDALYQPVEAFRMTTNLRASLGQRNNGSGTGLEQKSLRDATNLSSLLPPAYYADFNSASEGKKIKNDNKSINIVANLDIQYEPVKGIQLKNFFSYGITTGNSDIFRPSFLNNNRSEFYSYNDKKYSILNRSSLNYFKTIGKHNLTAFVFNEITSEGFRANAIQLNQTANDYIEGPLGYNWVQSKGGTLNNARDMRIHGYGGTVSYNFDTKYIFDFSYRMDGLSTNGPFTGYTQNPSVSVRWNFNKEKIFDNAAWLSYGSLRGSWGRNIVPTGDIYDVYGVYRLGNLYNNDPTVYTDWSFAPNEKFKQQTKTKWNLGLEFALFDYAIDAVFDTYYEPFDNQTTEVNLANINGFSKITSNDVSSVNYGFEWGLKFRVFKQNKPLQWTIGFNGAYNKDVLTQLPYGERQRVEIVTDPGTGVKVPVVKRLGRNSLSNLMFHNRGVFASTGDVPVNPATGKRLQYGGNTGIFFQAGDPIWTDINGDYIIDDQDLVTMGNPQPKFNGGINSNMIYKNFTFSFNITYTLGRDILNGALASNFRNYWNGLHSTSQNRRNVF